MKEEPTSSIKREMPSEPTLRRLPWYLSYVSELRDAGVAHVSSRRIGEALNVDAQQVVKDLSALRLRGRPRVGYDVAALERELQDALGFGRMHNAVIVGVGSLGGALIADRGLANYGLNIVAGFDISPDIIGTENKGVKIYSLDSLGDMCRATGAEIGIITVPASDAQSTADRLVSAGVRALWNFTPRRIVAPENVVIQNISIYAHLAVMYNRIDRIDT